jgi:hypothetical protein
MWKLLAERVKVDEIYQQMSVSAKNGDNTMTQHKVYEWVQWFENFKLWNKCCL